jgi:hypothetical protein
MRLSYGHTTAIEKCLPVVSWKRIEDGATCMKNQIKITSLIMEIVSWR